MAWRKKRNEELPDDDEYEQEESEEERERLPEIKPKEKPKKEISKEEISDMIKGHLARAMQLLDIFFHIE